MPRAQQFCLGFRITEKDLLFQRFYRFVSTSMKKFYTVRRSVVKYQIARTPSFCFQYIPRSGEVFLCNCIKVKGGPQCHCSLWRGPVRSGGRFCLRKRLSQRYVLAFVHNQNLLLTGLVNPQVGAYYGRDDGHQVHRFFVRGKRAG